MTTPIEWRGQGGRGRAFANRNPPTTSLSSFHLLLLAPPQRKHWLIDSSNSRPSPTSAKNIAILGLVTVSEGRFQLFRTVMWVLTVSVVLCIANLFASLTTAGQYNFVNKSNHHQNENQHLFVNIDCVSPKSRPRQAKTELDILLRSAILDYLRRPSGTHMAAILPTKQKEIDCSCWKTKMSKNIISVTLKIICTLQVGLLIWIHFTKPSLIEWHSTHQVFQPPANHAFLLHNGCRISKTITKEFQILTHF